MSLKKIIALSLAVGIGVGVLGFSQAKSSMNPNLEQMVSVEANTQELNPSKKVDVSNNNQKYELKIITGYIKSIDEDSLPVISSGWADVYNNETKQIEYQFLVEPGDFQFEHMRIYSEADKKVYNMLFPGPSNYQVGDHVKFKYEPMTILSFKELVGNYALSIGENPVMSPLQRGYFNIDGLIKRQDEGW